MENFLERKQKKQYRYLLFFCLAIFLLPLLVKSKYVLNVMIFSGIHSLIVVGFSLLMGYAGQISLGHAAFFGLGAYSSGILTVKFGIYPWIAFGAGTLVTVLAGVVDRGALGPTLWEGFGACPGQE